MNQNSRFGHVTTRPSAFDAECHPFHVMAWARFMRRAFSNRSATPFLRRFNGKLAFVNRGANLNRVIASQRAMVAATMDVARTWHSEASVDEFLFENQTLEETAIRLSTVSVMIAPAGAGILNA